jgi:ribosomal protein S27E
MARKVTCPGCGRQVPVRRARPGDVARCLYCGRELDPGELTEEPCPACDRPVPADADACPHCGETLGIPPWEVPGAVRRDAERHRGPLLVQVANYSALLAVPALLSLCCPLGLFAALLSLVLGVAVVGLASYDLRQMKRNLMEPTGIGLTRAARYTAWWGITLSLVSLLGAGVFWARTWGLF